MSEGFFDDLARTLASPMPRRRALRFAGAALVAAAVPGLRPRSAFGFSPCGPDTLCSSLCHSSPIYVGACGVETKNNCGQIGCRLEGCFTEREQCCKEGNTQAWLCPKNYKCAAKRSAVPNCIGCPEGLFPCGKKCCSHRYAERQVCYRGECLKTCPPNTRECGGKNKFCCPPNQECRNGKCCNKCGGNGTCCDPETTFCCREPGDPKSAGRCCKKGKESCCGVGPPGAQKRMCCPKPKSCARELPSGIGGLTATSPYVCCPPERLVPGDVKACCAPGQVSLGGKLLVGQGVQGVCCPENQLCGSGADLTCCQTGQSCIDGTTCG